MMAQTPRPAATLILLRPSAPGPEVLMLQRTQSAAFLGGAYVFPGGSLDPQDSDARLLKRVLGRTEDEANARLDSASELVADPGRVNGVLGDHVIHKVQLMPQRDAVPRQIVRRDRALLGEPADLFEAAASHEHGAGRHEIGPGELCGDAAAARP